MIQDGRYLQVLTSRPLLRLLHHGMLLPPWVLDKASSLLLQLILQLLLLVKKLTGFQLQTELLEQLQHPLVLLLSPLLFQQLRQVNIHRFPRNLLSWPIYSNSFVQLKRPSVLLVLRLLRLLHRRLPLLQVVHSRWVLSLLVEHTILATLDQLLQQFIRESRLLLVDIQLVMLPLLLLLMLVSRLHNPRSKRWFTICTILREKLLQHYHGWDLLSKWKNEDF
jgi:hypothetical protein